MSDPSLGRYHFLAWSRRGIAASIDHTDDGGALPSRAVLDVALALTAQQGGATNPVLPPPDTKAQLFGPGDVAGVDPRQIIRTEPRPFTVNYEPNYLCGIEFDQPDFPWLFTPASPNGDRLRPWVALIALKRDEFTVPNVAPNPLPVIDVLSITALQDLGESWNWAHVQINGDTAIAEAQASDPGNVSSRLLCPRRLDPETSYVAFLVPSFEIGRQVGLGLDVSAIATADPAWKKSTAAPLRLPIYFQFEFQTSDEGDFESLVRRLTPRVLPAEVGKRAMDVSTPAPNFPSAGGPLDLEGALHSISTKPSPWVGPDKDAFQSSLQTLLNRTTSTTDDPKNPNPDDPRVVPPMYGRWHAAVTSVDRTAPGWVNDLNLDPRNRSGGGMGTQVVQGERTQLMASAWQQVAGILEANQLLKQAQLARAALTQLYRQHLRPAMTETLLQLTAPVHARLLASPTTVRSTIRASRVPERMLSGTFRRVTRSRRRPGVAPAARNQLLTKVNAGKISIVPAAKPPGGMVSIEQVSDRLVPSWLPKWLKTWNQALTLGVILLLILFLVIGFLVGWVAALVVVAVAAAAGAALAPKLKSALANAAAANQLRVASFTPQAVATVPPQPNFQLLDAGVVPGSPGPASSGGDSGQASAFRSATEDLFAAFAIAPVDPPPRPALNLQSLQTTVLARLDPAMTVPARMRSLISVSASLPRAMGDPLDPIMAAPEFPQPMYAPLRDLSEQYILPGVELIPPDTMGLLQSNHAFIEGYMVGLNHEMARQLLWNDYPTDQRGSYFRQFWDVSAYVPQPSDPKDPTQLRELLKDIPPIHTWPKPDGLGKHENRTDVVADNVVLIVRGELFKRYPNAIVYAGKAKREGDKRVLDETDERYPMFRGTLSPDLTFLGFNLSVADARGGTATSPEGFFFVFQEQPAEPRFGLEPSAKNGVVTHWADLAWTNFGQGAAVLPEGQPKTRISKTVQTAASPWRLASKVFSMVLSNTKLPDFLSPSLAPQGIAIAGDAENPDDPTNTWGVNSAQTAYILLRLPFRVLVHADLMLPSL